MEATLQARLVALLYHHATTSLVLTLLAMLAVGVASMLNGPAVPVLAWWSCMGAVLVARYRLIRAFAAVHGGDFEAAPWRSRFALGATATGFGWGIGGIVLLIGAPQQLQILVLLVIAGAVLVAMPHLCAALSAYRGFMLGALVPIVAWLLFQGTGFHLLAASTGLGLLPLCWVVTSRLHRSLSNRERARIEAQSLSISLENANAQLRDDVARRQRSEQRLQDFASLAGDWLWEMDAELRYTYLSSNVENALDLPVSSHIGKTRLELASEDTHNEKWRAHQADLEAHRPFRDFEYTRTTADGSLKYFSASGVPVFDEQGRFTGYRGVGRDLSERVGFEQSLQHAHDELELRVKQRTAALLATNERLSTEVSEHRTTQNRLLARERHFRRILEDSPFGVAVMKHEWQGQQVKANRWLINDAFVQLLGGESIEQILRQDVAETWVDTTAMQRANEAMYRGEDLVDLEVRRRRLDGSEWWALMNTRSINIEGERYTVVWHTDITERQTRQSVLKENEARFRQYALSAADFFWETDANNHFRSLAGHFEQTSGLRLDDTIGKSHAEIWAQHVLEFMRGEPPDRAFEARQPFPDYDVRWRRHDGEERILCVSGTPFTDEHGQFAGFRGSVRDVTAEYEMAAALEHQASHDPLTGLFNRREFEQRLQALIDEAANTRSTHALCYVDLDQFKIVNDSCGHVAGDQLLRQLGSLLRARVRVEDTLARLGGDEFGILIANCTIDEAMAIARAFRETIESFRFHWSERTFTVSASIGIVPITRISGNIESVLSAADATCYAAKDQGRNRALVYKSEDRDLARRRSDLQWAAAISEALEQERFVLYAQPIESLTSEAQGEHYEVLLRLVDEHGEIVAPQSFWPAVERYQLATRVDRWVVAKTLSLLESHPVHLDALSMCSINLSGLSLGEEWFLQFVAEQFETYAVPPHKICFEITETAAISDLSNAVRFMNALSNAGCRFALDDFGSGLSSFQYLKDLPVDYLKIDGVFVRDIENDPIDLALVRAIHETGRITRKKTIAEFAQTPATLEILKELGIDFAQGFAIGRPGPLEARLRQAEGPVSPEPASHLATELPAPEQR